MGKSFTLTVIAFILMLSARSGLSFVTDGVIYVAEPVIEKDLETAKTVINICLGSQKKENIPQYGILNLSSGEFRTLKRSSSTGLEGEMSLIMFMGFDWYDWRQL